jgi:hypothetical protein
MNREEEETCKQELSLFQCKLKLNSGNKLELIHKIGTYFVSTNFWQKVNLIDFSKYLEDPDRDVKMATFNYLCDLVVDNDRMHHFNKIFLNVKFEEMNRRLECLGIFCSVRTNVYRYLFEKNKDFMLENEKLCEILNKQRNEEDDSRFTESIYSYLYELLDRKLILFTIKRNVDSTIQFLDKIITGLVLNKIFQERPLETVLWKQMLISQDEIEYVCMCMENFSENICISFIYNVVIAEQNLYASLSPSSISSIIFVFLKYYQKLTNINESDENILPIKTNDNEMIMKIYEKVSILYKISDYQILVSNSFKIFLNFLFKKMGFMGFCYFQKSIYYKNIFNCIFEVFKEQIENSNSSLHKLGIKESVTSKFIYLFFISFIGNNNTSNFSLLNFFNILLQNCKFEYFSFLENLITILSKKEIKDNHQYDNLWFILRFANQTKLFIFNEKFLNDLEGLLAQENKEEIFTLLCKVSEYYTVFNNWSLFLSPDFLNKFLILLDNHYLLPLWQLFIKAFAKDMKTYNSKYDHIYKWITTKLSDSSLPVEIINLIQNYSADLLNKKNPIIKEFMKTKEKENLPEMKIHQPDEYEDFMDPNDLSLSHMNLKQLVEESFSENTGSSGSTKTTSDKMTNVEKEEDLKEKVREIIKTSQKKKDYYEEIFQNLIFEVQSKNKNFTAVISNLLSRKISKSLYNLNKELLSYNTIITAHIDNTIKRYMNNINDKNYSFAHIILKVQISVIMNYVNIYVACFCELEKKIFNALIENCFKSLYIEANRAYNKFTGKGDLSTISEEKGDEPSDSLSNLDESIICNDSFSQEILNESKLIDPFICDDVKDDISFCKDDKQQVEDTSEILEEIFECIKLKNSGNFSSQQISSSKASFAYSKFSHIFSFTGYTYTLSKSRGACIKEVSVLLKSNFLPIEIKEKFKDYVILIIELEILYDYREQNNGINNKINESIEKWVSKNKNLLEKNNIFYTLN